MRWLVLMLLLMAALRLEAVVVVVNETMPLKSLGVDRVRDLLLGRITTWDSGQSVTIVLCTDATGEAAVNEICGRSVGLLQRGWKRLVFSGTGAMPLVVATRQSAFEAVVRHPGAIAVLMDAEPGSGYRIIPLSGAAVVSPPK